MKASLSDSQLARKETTFDLHRANDDNFYDDKYHAVTRSLKARSYVNNESNQIQIIKVHKVLISKYTLSLIVLVWIGISTIVYKYHDRLAWAEAWYLAIDIG